VFESKDCSLKANERAFQISARIHVNQDEYGVRKMYSYIAYGLGIQSLMPLPELKEVAKVKPDLIIRRGEIDRPLPTSIDRDGSYFHMETGEAYLRPRPDVVKAITARIGVRMGEVLSRSGDHVRARAILERAVAEAELHEAKDVAAEGLHYLAGVLGYTGDLQGAANLYRRCLESYERLENINGAARVHTNLGALYRRLARYDEALAEHRAALALAERMGNRWLAAGCYNNIGEVEKTRGDLDAAIASKQRALDMWTAVGAKSEAGAALMNIGFARVLSGQILEGRADLVEAESQLSAAGNKRYHAELWRGIAHAELGLSDLHAAESAAARSLDYAQAGKMRQEEAITQRTLGEIALARGDIAGARSLLETSRDRLAELGEVAELALTEARLAGIPKTGAAAPAH